MNDPTKRKDEHKQNRRVDLEDINKLCTEGTEVIFTECLRLSYDMEIESCRSS